MNDTSLAALSSDVLVSRLAELLGNERATLVDFLLHLGEMDRRHTALELGYASLQSYCREHLRLSKACSWRRVHAAWMLEKYPFAAGYLRDGRLCLTTFVMLEDVLTPENAVELLDQASRCTEEEVQLLVARLDPQPDRVESLRPLTPSAGSGPEPTPLVVPLREDRYGLRMNLSLELKEKLDEVRDALSHAVPDGNLEDVLAECFRITLAACAKRRRGAEKSRGSGPEPVREPSGDIPVAVKRAVCERDGDRCAYVSKDGRRCNSRRRLEFHHRVPRERGGLGTVENICLMCRSHNVHEARKDYGEAHMARFSRRAQVERQASTG